MGKAKNTTSTKKKPRGNVENLVPMNKRSKDEARKLGQKGGIESVKTRRENSDRMKQAQMILNLAVKDPNILNKLDELGIPATKRNLETAMDASVVNRVIETGDPTAYKVLKEEAYGKMETRDNSLSVNLNIDSARFGGEFVIDAKEAE